MKRSPLVSTSGASLDTSIVCVEAPTSRGTFRVDTAPTVRFSAGRRAVLKPEASTVISYLPTGNCERLYKPAPVVLVWRRNPISGLRAVTFAPATVAPEGSVTVPLTPVVPTSDCAQAE